MESPDHTASAFAEATADKSAEEEAATAINETIDEADSSEVLVQDLAAQAKEAEGEKAAHIQEYVDGIRPHLQSVLMKDLGPTGGGLYDGNKKTIGKAALYVEDDIKTAVERENEVYEHETYHEENDHTAEMISGDSATGDTVVTMGTQAFDRETFIEGLTVRRTGERFVSDMYKEFRGKFDRALRASGQTVEDVERAVKAKDLRLIDDENRRKKTMAQAA